MAYTPINFKNKQSGGTPVSAANLNHMEDGIAQAHNLVPTESGSVGQVLTKTQTGTSWQDADNLPDGGTEGQVLTRTANNGAEWTDAGNPTASQVATATSAWLDEHVTEIPATAPIVDTSLLVSGAAADSATVGTEISDLKSALNGYESLSLVPNEYVKSNGDFASYTGWSRTGYIPCGDIIPYLLVEIPASIPQYCAFYDTGKAYISSFQIAGSGLKKVSVPSNAKYFALSAETSIMQNVKVYGDGKINELINFLLEEIVPNSSQAVSFDSDGRVTSIVHNRDGAAIRRDELTYSTTNIVEYRTDVQSGFYLTITTNLNTFETEVA